MRLSHEISQLVREAIANAAKHGEAREVAIFAAVADRNLSLTFRDNGRGFGGKAKASAPRSLSERVRELGGSVSVDSTPGGATITLRLPWEEQS